VATKRGPITDYLQHEIGLRIDSEFRGYASSFLGAPGSLVRGRTDAASGVMTYIAARDVLFEHFENSFQMMDLWDAGIPTLEEYGQWVSKQMYYFDRDLLAEPQDQINPVFIHLYRFRPALLRALGVRFVIADGTLADPSIELVMTEAGKAGAAINLYEINGANLGQFSPTRIVWKGDYAMAVAALRQADDLNRRVVLLGAPQPLPGLAPASRARLVAIRDGYRVTAAALETAMLVLPVQFSHCWRIESPTGKDLPRLFRANVVQTGILFKGDLDVTLRFDFEPWRAGCRRQDARDLALFGFR
jgi:hypothetical protein